VRAHDYNVGVPSRSSDKKTNRSIEHAPTQINQKAEIRGRAEWVVNGDKRGGGGRHGVCSCSRVILKSAAALRKTVGRARVNFIKGRRERIAHAHRGAASPGVTFGMLCRGSYLARSVCLTNRRRAGSASCAKREN